jgi:hypothetical protein
VRGLSNAQHPCNIILRMFTASRYSIHPSKYSKERC